jgi:hypothetical protein
MQPRRRGLATAQWIVTLMYVVPLVVYPLVPRFVHPEVKLEATTLHALSYVLLLVSVVDYGVSLFVERLLLAKARPGAGSAGALTSPGSATVVTTALIVGAFGASLAVCGLVLTLLGARTWGAVLYVLCALHGLHLLTRWPAYVRVTEGAPEDSPGQD